MEASINNVSIGDRFKTGKNGTAKVVDIREVKSLVTGIRTGFQCIAVGEGLASNHFEVPFSTVVRNRIYNAAEIQEYVEQSGLDS